jgi:hypothetical protein
MSFHNQKNECKISSKRQKMDKGIFFVTLRQIEKMHTMELKEHFAGRIFSLISETADELGLASEHGLDEAAFLAGALGQA